MPCERMNGNGELTETENVIFYVSYGVLTDERNSYVLATARIVATDSQQNARNQARGRIPFSPNRFRILSLNRFRFACANVVDCLVLARLTWQRE